MFGCYVEASIHKAAAASIQLLLPLLLPETQPPAKAATRRIHALKLHQHFAQCSSRLTAHLPINSLQVAPTPWMKAINNHCATYYYPLSFCLVLEALKRCLQNLKCPCPCPVSLQVQQRQPAAALTAVTAAAAAPPPQPASHQSDVQHPTALPC